jgi:hypothetical protein
MSSAPSVPANALPHEPSALAAVLSLLIPGLGQIYQGRFGKGFLFMVSLLGMFWLGQALGNWQNVYLPLPDNRAPGEAGKLTSALLTRWHYLGQFWIGVSAWPALYQYFQQPPADQTNFWANFQRMPDEQKVNEFLVNNDKTPDLGWVYTVIAGMLNILVIYDAYAGPMFGPAARKKDGDPRANEPAAQGGVA